MRNTLIAKLIWALIPLALAGCSKPGKVYDQAPAAAEAALAGSRIPDMVTGGVLESQPATVNGNDVIWSISSDSNPSGKGGAMPGFRLVAHIEPEGQGSRISTEIRAATDGDAAAFAARREKMGSAFNVVDAITREQVDSTLNHRAFSMTAISTALALAMPDLLPLMREQIDKAAEESAQAYREDREANAEPIRPEDNAAPQDDTRPIDDTQPDSEK